MTQVKDSKGITIESTLVNVVVKIESKELDYPFTLVSPDNAIKLGRALIQRAYQIKELQNSFLVGKDN